MRYYTIQEETQLLIADKVETLSKFYNYIQELPEDYEMGKYIIGNKDVEIDVNDVDEEGNIIYVEVEEEITVVDYDDEGNPIGEHTETITKQIPKTHKETITIKTLILNPNWEEEQAEKREADFNKAFFNTSLGYIRRSVTMADGSHKDFLSDLLPIISMGAQTGQTVKVIAYDKPPFDEDITDWEPYQHKKEVTPQFIQECFSRVSADFGAV